LKRRIYLSVELGLQSIHEQSLSLLNRNHTYAQFQNTFAELKARGIDVIVHLMVGIPGESAGHMLQTVKAMNELKPAGIKFHLFHILRDTELHSQYEKSPFPLLCMEEYTDIMVELLEHLDPGIVVHRLTAEREKEIFFAPQWALNKQAVLGSIKAKLREKCSFQGKCMTPC
jgi:radical SAM protein (TIGR01212 family)